MIPVLELFNVSDQQTIRSVLMAQSNIGLFQAPNIKVDVSLAVDGGDHFEHLAGVLTMDHDRDWGEEVFSWKCYPSPFDSATLVWYIDGSIIPSSYRIDHLLDLPGTLLDEATKIKQRWKEWENE